MAIASFDLDYLKAMGTTRKVKAIIKLDQLGGVYSNGYVVEYEPWEDNEMNGAQGRIGEIYDHQAAVTVYEYNNRWR